VSKCDITYFDPNWQISYNHIMCRKLKNFRILSLVGCTQWYACSQGLLMEIYCYWYGVRYGSRDRSRVTKCRKFPRFIFISLTTWWYTKDHYRLEVASRRNAPRGGLFLDTATARALVSCPDPRRGHGSMSFFFFFLSLYAFPPKGALGYEAGVYE